MKKFKFQVHGLFILPKVVRNNLYRVCANLIVLSQGLSVLTDRSTVTWLLVEDDLQVEKKQKKLLNHSSHPP